MKHWLCIISALIILSSCSEKKSDTKSEFVWTPLPLEYAKGFTIEEGNDAYRIKILTPFKGAQEQFTYLFLKNDTDIISTNADVKVLMPVSSIVCTSTTHIPLLDYLGESEALVGFPTLDYISSEKTRKLINSGKVSELGIGEALNIERLIELKPDLIMGYSLSGDLGQFKLVEEAGIPVIINAEYLEQHPLGRAEWIKLMGIIFDKQAEADSVFTMIKNEYLVTVGQIRALESRPTVLSGVVYGDSWYLPGGRNYASTLLNDAGYDFFWASDTTSAFLPISFEKVFDQAYASDYWIGVASYTSLEEIAKGDQRYTAFNAFKQKNVYSYNKRIGEKGGSEFLELGYLRPDLILKDLVKIAHPDLLPDHDLFFHFKLP